MESPRTEDDIVLDISTPRDLPTDSQPSDNQSPADWASQPIPDVIISEHIDSEEVGISVREVEDFPSADADVQRNNDGGPDEGQVAVTQTEERTEADFTPVVINTASEGQDSKEDEDKFTAIVSSTPEAQTELQESSSNSVKVQRDDKGVSDLASEAKVGETSSVQAEREKSTVSLENILMKEKKEESDSDSEFDFDLPPSVQKQETAEAKPVVKPATDQPPVSTALTGVQPLVSTSLPGQQQDTAKPASTISTAPDTPTAQTVVSSTGVPSTKPVAVIKPISSQSIAPESQDRTQPGDGASSGPSPETQQQRVLESAQAEWDNVTTIQAGFAENSTARGPEPTVVVTAPMMTFQELQEHFQSTDFSAVRSSVRTSVERRGFSAFVHMLFGPPKLNRNLHQERDLIFCIAATNLANENTAHIRTLQTIYRCLTGSKFDCSRTGSHWEEIGFQGNDPATDLRGAGLLGLLNLLYFLREKKLHSLITDIYKLSLHPTQNFPFCIMGINLTRIVLQTLREDLLNKECNKRQEVTGVVNEFYVGLYLQLYLTWKQGKTISDSGFILKELETQAKKNPRSVLKTLEDYLTRKRSPNIHAEPMPDSGGDNFHSVCDED